MFRGVKQRVLTMRTAKDVWSEDVTDVVPTENIKDVRRRHLERRVDIEKIFRQVLSRLEQRSGGYKDIYLPVADQPLAVGAYHAQIT